LTLRIAPFISSPTCGALTLIDLSMLYPHSGITPEATVAGARRLLATQPEAAIA